MTDQNIEPVLAWSHAAVKALRDLPSSRHGRRSDDLLNVASELGLNPQTLRRAIAGWRFVQDLSTDRPELARKLPAQPIAAVEHLNRWYQRDPAGALKAATTLIAGKYTVRSLAAAEKKDRLSRKDSLSTEAGRARESVFRARLAETIRHHLADSESRQILEPKWQSFAPPFDLIVDQRWGVITVGPYRDTAAYRARATDWCFRADSYARYGGVSVLLVVPAPEHVGVFLAFLSHYGISEDVVSVAGCNIDASQEEIWNAIGPTLMR
jgi:hypothetical protein